MKFKDLGLKPIGEHSYSWAEGFIINQPRYEGGMRQIDWDKVKYILDSNCFERIEIGLAEDYYQTHATIFQDSECVIIENDGAGFYGASRWATPAIKLTQNGETMLFECWILGSETGFPNWLKEKAVRHTWGYDYELDDEDNDEDDFE